MQKWLVDAWAVPLFWGGGGTPPLPDTATINNNSKRHAVTTLHMIITIIKTIIILALLKIDTSANRNSTDIVHRNLELVAKLRLALSSSARPLQALFDLVGQGEGGIWILRSGDIGPQTSIHALPSADRPPRSWAADLAGSSRTHGVGANWGGGGHEHICPLLACFWEQSR